MSRLVWTDELDAILIKEWRRKTPIEEIAKLLGVDKQPVISRACSLRALGTILRRRSRDEEAAYGAAFTARGAAEDAAVSLSEPDDDQDEEKPHPIEMKPWAEVGPAPRKCQWLRGAPRKRDFCGLPTKPGSSYCPGHHKRAYHRVKFVRRPNGGISTVPVPDNIAAE